MLLLGEVMTWGPVTTIRRLAIERIGTIAPVLLPLSVPNRGIAAIRLVACTLTCQVRRTG